MSSIGRRYLGRSVGLDDDGFNFRIPRFLGEVCFEVKAHTGDPGYVDLERSQVIAAASMAEEVGSRRWGILYVTNVKDPALIAVHELPNPYSKAGGAFFRERQRSGVRLMIQKKQRVADKLKRCRHRRHVGSPPVAVSGLARSGGCPLPGSA